MAGQFVKDKSASCTSTSAGQIILGSTTGWYLGAVVCLRDSTATIAGRQGKIVNVLSSTVIVVRLDPVSPTGGVNYSYEALSGFDGITQPAQFVYNPNELPLPFP